MDRDTVRSQIAEQAGMDIVLLLMEHHPFAATETTEAMCSCGFVAPNEITGEISSPYESWAMHIGVAVAILRKEAARTRRRRATA